MAEPVAPVPALAAGVEQQVQGDISRSSRNPSKPPSSDGPDGFKPSERRVVGAATSRVIPDPAQSCCRPVNLIVAGHAEYRYQVEFICDTSPQLQVEAWRRLPGSRIWIDCSGPMAIDTFIACFLPEPDQRLSSSR